MVPRISVAEHAKRKRSAIHQNLHRPKRTRTDHTFAAVLNAALGFLKPEVGNLSWVSHEAIAREVPCGKRTVAHYLTAATLIGAITVAYRTARAAHKGTIRFYPSYTDCTFGQTFPMLIKAELDNKGRVKPKTLNFYRLNRNWIGYSMVPEYLPDWMIEVIRLCATKKAANVREAKRLAAIHRIGCQTKGEGSIVNDPADTLPDSPVGRERGIVNDPADTPTHKLGVYSFTNESGIVNDPARGEQTVLLREHGAEETALGTTTEKSEKQDHGAGKPALVVSGEYARPDHTEVETPEQDPQHQREQAYLASEAHQRYLKIKAECLAQTKATSPTKIETQKATEATTNPVTVRQSSGPHRQTAQSYRNREKATEKQNLGRASSPGPSCGGVPPQPGPAEVSPPVTPEDTNPARVRLSWGQHRQTAAQSRQDREKATEKQEPGAGKPALAVSGEYARPGHLEVSPPVTPEKAPPISSQRSSLIKQSSQRSSLIKQHQAYLARDGCHAHRTRTSRTQRRNPRGSTETNDER